MEPSRTRVEEEWETFLGLEMDIYSLPYFELPGSRTYPQYNGVVAELFAMWQSNKWDPSNPDSLHRAWASPRTGIYRRDLGEIFSFHRAFAMRD
jgi:hypothetical protein